MCLICNTTDHDGADFLGKFSEASAKMREAAAALRHASQHSKTPEDRKRYDRAHKRMVRLIREWNSIEHQREAALDAVGLVYFSTMWATDEKHAIKIMSERVAREKAGEPGTGKR